MIICFSGTDGAGKSTQIALLSEFYLQKGKKVKCLWSRGGYTPIFSFVKDLARKLLNKKLPESGNTQARDDMLGKKTVSRIWLIMAELDLILLYGIYVRVLSMFGIVVICDRYLNDTIVDFRRNFDDQFDERSLLMKILHLTTPIPYKSFLLYVPVHVSKERSLLKKEPFPDSLETLEYRLNHYMDEDVFSSEDYNKIDCQKSVSDVHIEIMNILRH